MFVAVFFRRQQPVPASIQHIVRLATGGTGQRQRAEMRAFFTQQLWAGAQQHAAV
jgi:hypothetical protein